MQLARKSILLQFQAKVKPRDDFFSRVSHVYGPSPHARTRTYICMRSRPYEDGGGGVGKITPLSASASCRRVMDRPPAPVSAPSADLISITTSEICVHVAQQTNW